MTSVYKYFSNRKYAEDFLAEGKIFFNSLSYFTTCEETQLRDEREGALIYQPKEGLEINNLTASANLRLDAALVSKVRNSHRIFVFCTSFTRSNELAKRFSSEFCVEIESVEGLQNRLLSTMRNPIYRLKNQRLLFGRINYAADTKVPGVDHALAEKIVFRKSPRFEVEDEYRIAFALDTKTFDANQVDYALGAFTPPSSTLCNSRTLKVGALIDICKFVSI